MTNELLFRLYETGISTIKNIVDIAKENNVLNTQEFLNFLDELNEISVSY